MKIRLCIIEMSDAYLRNITLKYRLAVAIAVLKGKPQDVSIENYIEDLKNKLNNENTDDLDLTVCSDDFDVEENAAAMDANVNITNKQTNSASNSVTILKDNNLQFHGTDVELNESNAHTRQEITENIDILETNFIEDSQIGTQESINLPQIAKSSDLETFCLTQQAQNVVQNSTHKTVFNLNKVMETNKVNVNNSKEVDSDRTYYDSQATELYSLHGYTQNYTHISQSQNNEIIINDMLLKAKNNVQQFDNSEYTILEIGNLSQNTSNTVFFNNNSKDYNTHCPTIEIGESNILTNEINEVNTTVTENQLSIQINDSFSQYAQDLNNIQMSPNRVTEIDENCQINENNYKENEEINGKDDLNNESQIVSFKVVEELSKIKNYINKKVERRMSNDSSMDSGYRSDSQSKCSFRSSLQPSGNWLNQSAHSLYEYITQCPLLVTTHEIIEEIAQVLGQLIDKLHEEEKYPSFLDELLENVNNSLQELFEQSGGEDILLRKDENVQRLLLLNKSVHIQKYTIEKITTILENLLPHLTNPEETYELANISQMENTSYIFHLLEVILKRYIKCNNVSSQELTDSQIELKRSSITELWRKKWNPNYKEDVIEEYTPRKCVLVKCNEILNKLVVASMDGYSLIAFAALNCFNMLQS